MTGALDERLGIETAGGVSYIYSRKLRELGAVHGVTMRHGGVSGHPYDTLNLGWNREEPQENVRENYRRLARAVGVEMDSMVLCSYCHGDGVERVTAADCGKGMGDGQQKLPPCDALVSNDPGVTMLTLHADCMPVVLFDPASGVGGICHAGWQGTAKRVGAKTAQKMAELGAETGEIHAFIGPSICRECFEVDAPVMEIFAKAFAGLDCIEQRGEKYHIDLPKVMAHQLAKVGLRAENIENCGVCTMQSDDYYSYRRDGKRFGGTGAMAGFLRVAGR